MHRGPHRINAAATVLGLVVLAAAATVAVVLISELRIGSPDPVLLAPAIVTAALLTSVACARGWSRGRERRRQEARAVAPPLTWAHPDVTEAAMSDPGRRERLR